MRTLHATPTGVNLQTGQPLTYLDELLAVLAKEEGNFEGIYDDRADKHNPTIGIGLNLNDSNVRLATLLELGVFSASDDQRLRLNGLLGPESFAERKTCYDSILATFDNVLTNHPLSAPPNTQAVPYGSDPSEQQLQSALSVWLGNLRPDAEFKVLQATSRRVQTDVVKRVNGVRVIFQ